MEPYLLLLILVPSTAAFVDCRTACRSCREHKVPTEMLEVYCSMCEECKERRREKMMDKMKYALKEGPPVAHIPEIPHTSEPTTSNYPEMHFPDLPQQGTYPDLPQENLPQIQKLDNTMINYLDVDGCPVQSPCSDEEEVTTPGIKRLSYTSTTTTTTTTTKRPCPTIRPCRKKPTTPLLILPPSLPPPPPVPIIPPPYPVNNCFIPNVQSNPCPGYSYMRQAVPMMMAPGMLPASVPGYIYQPYIPGQKGHYGTHGVYNQVNHPGNYEKQETGLYTDRVNESTSGERTTSIDDLTGTPRIKQLNASQKDFVYVYVGVPKNMKSRLS